MWLLIDVGNTRLKWAIAPVRAAGVGIGTGGVGSADPGNDNGGDWIASGAVAHGGGAGLEPEALGAAWARYPVAAVLVSNVAGAALADAVNQALARLRLPNGALPPVCWFASEARVGGVQNRYREPHRLGCDRLAALIGARALRPGCNLIVATCGTATTIDALTADGVFIGGMILPGLGTMAQSLARGTAQLPAVSALPPGPGDAGRNGNGNDNGIGNVTGDRSGDGNSGGNGDGDGSITSSRDADGGTMPSPFADHTEAAIRNGCLAAQAGAIARAVAAHGQAACLLSGGAAAWISPVLPLPHVVHENLVLTGLRIVADTQPERFAHPSFPSDRTGGASPAETPSPC